MTPEEIEELATLTDKAGLTADEGLRYAQLIRKCYDAGMSVNEINQAILPARERRWAAEDADQGSINALCDAADDMDASTHEALENRLRRKARQQGLHLQALPESDARACGPYRYELFDIDPLTGEYVDAMAGDGRELRRGLHLGEVQHIIEQA